MMSASNLSSVMCARADVAVCYYTFQNNRSASAVVTGSVAKMRSSCKMMGEQRCKCRFIVVNKRVLNHMRNFQAAEKKTCMATHLVGAHAPGASLLPTPLRC